MMRYVETFVGSTLIVVVVACMPGLRHPTSAGAIESGAAPRACATPLARAPLLCNRVLKDGSAECAICDRDQRSCMSSTHIYCAPSCDDAACVTRPAK